MPARAPRLVVGNLDAEVELGPQYELKTAVVEMISAAAASLSVFADEDDMLWTPAPVDQARMPPGSPQLVTGPLDDISPPSAVLAWGETPRVARLRRQPEPPASRVWTDLLWSASPPVNTTRACNDRRFAYRLARELDAGPAGAQLVTSVPELESILADRDEAPWVVKAPLSAAGRDRLRRRNHELDDAVRVRIERLLAQGPLLFEPWLDRLCDVGAVGLVLDDGVLLFPPHGLVVDPGGVFRGIELDDQGSVGLEGDERARLDVVLARVAVELKNAGYRGPFGIDAFVHAGSDGKRSLVALCEINARLTFGHVARAHAEAQGMKGRVLFGLGAAVPAGATTLVSAAAPDHLAVWITPAAD